MSTAFLTGLKQANCKNIGKLFIEFAPCLRAYSPFLSSYMAGINTLQALQKDKSRKSKWLEFLVGLPFWCLLANKRLSQILRSRQLKYFTRTNRRRDRTT